MPYNRRVNLVRDGEQVKAGTPNRPLGQLAQNTDYLLSLIDAASLGATVFARSVSVEAGAAVGMPVYCNTATARFERALARRASRPRPSSRISAGCASTFPSNGRPITSSTPWARRMRAS